MATTKITDLTAYTNPVNTDVLPIVDVTSDVTKKVSIANLMKNASLGTAGAPSIAFDGDPNTGIYSPGADQVAVATNGTGRLFVDASGNVGVGQPTPTAGLHVYGTVNTTVRIEDQGEYLDLVYNDNGSTLSIGIINADNGNTSVGSTELRIGVDSENRYIISADGTHSFFRSGGVNEALRIDSSGRLLVGTASIVALNTGAAPRFPANQIANLSSSNTARYSLSCIGYETTNGGNGAVLNLGRTKAATLVNTLVSSGDVLGSVEYSGADNSGYIAAASIRGEVDGTPGANDMPGRLVFSTTADAASSPTERMRIQANGNFRIGQTSTDTPGLGNTTTGIGFEPGNGAIFLSRANDASLYLNSNADASVANFSRSGSFVGSISVTTTNTTYNTSSDYRLKENVTAVTDGITRLQQLKPSRFNFIADPDTVVDGFLAHEVQTIVPEAITGEKDAVDDDGNPEYQGIDQSKLVPLLTAALQEAIAKIEVLEQRLNDAGIN